MTLEWKCVQLESSHSVEKHVIIIRWVPQAEISAIILQILKKVLLCATCKSGGRVWLLKENFCSYSSIENLW